MAVDVDQRLQLGGIRSKLHLDRLVAPAFTAARDELLVPHVHLRQVREAALGERPQQVQGRRRLVIGGDESFRIGRAGRSGGRQVVDDVPANVDVVLGFLSNAGYRVLVSDSGKRALQQLALALPDIILLDLMMP